MIFKIKLSEYFAFEEIRDIETLEDFNFISSLINDMSYLNIIVSEEDIEIYRSVNSSKEENLACRNKILYLKKESIISSIHSNLKDIFTNFLEDKKTSLEFLCTSAEIYIGDENYCKTTDGKHYFEIGDKKINKIDCNKIDNYNYVYFDINLKKISSCTKLLNVDFKSTSKIEVKRLMLKEIENIVKKEFESEELERLICSAEYDWIERIEID